MLLASVKGENKLFAESGHTVSFIKPMSIHTGQAAAQADVIAFQLMGGLGGVTKQSPANPVATSQSSDHEIIDEKRLAPADVMHNSVSQNANNILGLKRRHHLISSLLGCL